MHRQTRLPYFVRAGSGAATLAALVLAGIPGFASAAVVQELMFDSPEQAVQALYTAVSGNNADAMARLLGPLASCGNAVQDKAEREQFMRKYSEMHRLVKDADGKMALYIGAENWPFPVPLISDHGKWSFDVDTGTREVLFRRIGDDETAAIDTARSMAEAIAHADAGRVTAQSSHGYEFRILRTSTGAIVLAYPIDYETTGIMTFVATAEGAVYQKDLGPDTARRGREMTMRKPDRTWRVAED